MSKQTIATIKSWFVTNAKPIQQQFADWLDSFRHKDDKIGSDDLTPELQNKINNAGGGAAPDLSGYLKTTEKGTAGGVASLGTDGKVPASQLPAGQKGDQGLSAFQVWVSQGNPNDIGKFWDALKGNPGTDGKGVYELAVAHGFVGTEDAFLASLHGAKGADGRSAYQVWVDDGNTGTVGDFLASLKGPKGDVGASTWATLQDKPTTAAGFGLTDVYTMDQTDAKLSRVYTYKGSVPNYSDLPVTGQKIGDVYNVENPDPNNLVNAGDNVAWSDTGWDILAGMVDISGKQDKSERNLPSGYAGLDTDGQVPQALMPYKKNVVLSIAEGGVVNYPTGTTVLVVDTVDSVLNASLLLPANPIEGQRFRVWFGGIVTANGKMIVNRLTVAGNGNQLLETVPPSVIVSGDMIEYHFINQYWRGE